MKNFVSDSNLRILVALSETSYIVMYLYKLWFSSILDLHVLFIFLCFCVVMYDNDYTCVKQRKIKIEPCKDKTEP